MKLENAIQQFKFKSPLNKAFLNLIYTAGRIHAAQTRFFKQYDISPQQYNVLRILRGQHPNAASMGLVQERMLDQNSNASRLVEKLKQKNLVKRSECKADRRQVDLVITKLGLQLLEQLDELLPKMEEGFNKLSEVDFETLNRLLDTLNEETQ